MTGVPRNAGKLTVTVVPVSQLARLGLPAFVALVGLVAFLVVAVLAWTSWVLNNDERAKRMAQLLNAIRGQP
jgi:hypothetical protein